MSSIRDEIVALIPRLRRFAHGLAGTIDRGDDLVQVACERALSRGYQWQKGTRLDSWMYTIIRNAHIDQVRAEVSHTDKLQQWNATRSETGERPHEGESELLLGSIDEAMQQLSDSHREILMMVCVEGLSYKEVAGILDIPVGTVTSRLVRARHQLMAVLDDGDS